LIRFRLLSKSGERDQRDAASDPLSQSPRDFISVHVG
jgi:hypothetical protein